MFNKDKMLSLKQKARIITPLIKTLLQWLDILMPSYRLTKLKQATSHIILFWLIRSLQLLMSLKRVEKTYPIGTAEKIWA
jgi:hypothetical protein